MKASFRERRDHGNKAMGHWFMVALILALIIPANSGGQETVGLQTVEPFAGTVQGSLLGAVINLVNAFLSLVSFLAAVFIIIGGVQFIVSGGDEDARAQASAAVLNAIIGIIIVALSAVLVNFVINAI